MNHNEQQYLDLLRELFEKSKTAEIRIDRTKVGTISVFGRTLEFDLTDNKIPLITTKKINYSSVLHELFWMFRLKNQNTDYLDEHNVKIWKEWYAVDKETGKNTIGRMYGQILRQEDCDQLLYVIDLLKRNPTSRRAVFTLFDPTAVADERLTFQENVDQNRGVLNNCHGVCNQFYINDKGNLELYTYQRSKDLAIGACFNYPFYATLTHLVAHILGIKAERLIYAAGDIHLYSNLIEAVELQLTRTPYECPTITIDPSIKEFDDWNSIDQIQLHNYQHHPFIKMDVAV